MLLQRTWWDLRVCQRKWANIYLLGIWYKASPIIFTCLIWFHNKPTGITLIYQRRKQRLRKIKAMHSTVGSSYRSPIHLSFYVVSQHMFLLLWLLYRPTNLQPTQKEANTYTIFPFLDQCAQFHWILPVDTLNSVTIVLNFIVNLLCTAKPTWMRQ